MTFIQKNIVPLFILGLAIAFTLIALFAKPAQPTEAAEIEMLHGPFVIASSTVSTTTSTSILATSSGRTYARITNDGPYTVYLAIGQAAVKGRGIVLAAGEAFVIDQNNLFSGAVNGVASTSVALGPAVNVSVIYKNGNL